MENQLTQEPKKLNAKMSDFKTDMSYNEWVKKFNVSRDYVEPTKYFQGNPMVSRVPEPTFWETMKDLFRIQVR